MSGSITRCCRGRDVKLPGKTNPALLALLKDAKGHVTTKEEKDAQRKSWVVGELMLAHPEMTREYVEEVYKKAVVA